MREYRKQKETINLAKHLVKGSDRLYTEEKGGGFKTELMRKMEAVDDFRAPAAKEEAEIRTIFKQNVIRGAVAENRSSSSHAGGPGGSLAADNDDEDSLVHKKINLLFPGNLPKLKSLAKSSSTSDSTSTKVSKLLQQSPPKALPPSGDPHFSDASIVHDARWLTKSPDYEDQVVTVTVRHTEVSKWGAGDILSVYPVMQKANVDEVLEFFGCNGDQWVKIRKAVGGESGNGSGGNDVPPSECLVEALKWREREVNENKNENTTIMSEAGSASSASPWIYIHLDELMSTYVDVAPRPTSRYIYRILASLVVGDETNAHIGEIKFFLQKEVDLRVIRQSMGSVGGVSSSTSSALDSPEFPLSHLCSKLGVFGSDLLFDQVKYIRLPQAKVDEIHAVVEGKKQDLRTKAAGPRGDEESEGEKARKLAEAADETLTSLAEAVEKEQFLAQIQREKLLIFASGTLEGKSELYNYVKKTQRSLFDVIRDFAKAKADFELMLNCVFPLILPREYSIASGNMRHAKGGVGRISGNSSSVVHQSIDDDYLQKEKDSDTGLREDGNVANDDDSLGGALLKSITTIRQSVSNGLTKIIGGSNKSTTPEDLSLSSSLSFPATTPSAVVMMTLNPLLHSHTWYSQLMHSKRNSGSTRNTNSSDSEKLNNNITSLLSEISSECLPQVCVSVLDTHEAYMRNKSRIKPLPRRGLCSNYIAGLGDSPLALVRCGLKISKTVAGPVRDGYEWESDTGKEARTKDAQSSHQNLSMALVPEKARLIRPHKSRRNPGVIIYVSTGTGISPVRALIQERGRLMVGSGGSESESENEGSGTESTESGDMQLNVSDICMEHATGSSPDVLFVGHRYRNEDFLFGEEWQQLDVFSGEENAEDNSTTATGTSTIAEKKNEIIRATQGREKPGKAPKPNERDKKLLRMDPYRKHEKIVASEGSSATAVSVHGAFSRDPDDDQNAGKFYVQHAVESMPSKQKMRKLLIESKNIAIVIAGRSESMPDAVERAFVKVLTGETEDDEEDFEELRKANANSNNPTVTPTGADANSGNTDDEPVNPGCLSTVAAKKLLARMRQEGRYVIDTWG